MANHSGIRDNGSKLQIIPHTRRVNVPNTCEIIGTVGDHNSEQLTFQCPKFIDGHEVEKCASHYISWVNAEGQSGKSKVVVDGTDEENFYFTWVIDAAVTSAEGAVLFAVHFVDYGEGGTVAYRWSTTTNDSLKVLPTMAHHSDDDSDESVLYIEIDDAALQDMINTVVGGVLNG